MLREIEWCYSDISTWYNMMFFNVAPSCILILLVLVDSPELVLVP